MALCICALFVLFCLETVSIATGQADDCGDIPYCQTSINNNCLCYKLSSGDKYAICSCTNAYSLDTLQETGMRECCLMQAFLGDSCDNDDQCELSSKDLVCIGGCCQCKDGYEYRNETESCEKTSTLDFHGAAATVAVGTTCIVLILVLVLLILLFMHRKAKTERQLRYLRSRINTRGPPSPHVQQVETIKEASPPSYNEIERGETPPPPFESLTSIFDDNENHVSD